MKRGMLLGAIAMMICLYGSPATQADDALFSSATQQAHEVGQTILQIGGRFCEYHRADVEAALRQFASVQGVKFLNNHGTVLVQFEPTQVPPERLAASIEQVLADGWGCKTWVDRGEAAAQRH